MKSKPAGYSSKALSPASPRDISQAPIARAWRSSSS